MTTTTDYLNQRIDSLREISLDITSLKDRPKKEIFDNMVHYYTGMRLCVALLKSLDPGMHYESSDPSYRSLQKLTIAFEELLNEKGVSMTKEQKIVRYCETFDTLYSSMLNIMCVLTKS